MGTFSPTAAAIGKPVRLKARKFDQLFRGTRLRLGRS